MSAQRLAYLAVSLVLLGGAAPVGASRVPVRTIDGDLLTALAHHDRAQVIVALRPVRTARTFAGLVSSAVRARSGLLDRVRPADGFRATARWDAVLAVPGIATREGVARLAADPGVLRVGLEGAGGSAGGDRDTRLIGADVAHAQGFTGRGVNVAVIDTGVAETHPDLRTSLIGEHCFVPSGCPNGASEQDGPGSAPDQNGHGTNVAGIVTSDGTVAPLGVAPASGLVAVKVLDASGHFQSLAQIVSALNWVATARPDVRVVNMSLGTNAAYPGICDQANAATLAVASAVNALRARGVLPFASAMNDSLTTTMPAPACISGVVAVGAVHAADLGPFVGSHCTDPITAPDRVACFSDSDPALDLLGPGVGVVSTGVTGGTSSYTGTSQASPHGAGAAALLLQASPALSAADVERVLEVTGKPVRDPRNGLTRPRLDVVAALRALSAPVADVRLAPGTLSFGRVRVGSARTLKLVVRSVGLAPLSVRMVNQPSGFSVRPRTFSLPSGANASVAVTFRPRAARSYAGRLIVNTNAPAAVQLLVRMRGSGG